MGIIKLTNIRLHAHHGCLKEESIIGSEYRVDISLTTDLKKAAITDNLVDTVDYVHINHIVKEEMAIPAQLLEHVSKRIMDRVYIELPTVDEIEISVSKINPPIGGDVEMVTTILCSKRT
ncbi:dihydroneopterin aldolase [Maribacter polysaccharolyticus]|uniref:dihydroneopterin aldolase n=1 Tax=Maribacter polysaccharolyticus TaxID=3020831 RepID=UPI00237FA056|nr:dihydroneopterin aldolase [Maribacter polysaccharolyticus]MDE3742180.1 dihydroneopterin aldolase [Maribacter polysaccharolyticus]